MWHLQQIYFLQRFMHRFSEQKISRVNGLVGDIIMFHQGN